MSDAEFELYRVLIYNTCGINFTDAKKQLLISRLRKRLDAIGVKTYREYREYVIQPENLGEFTLMIDCISTNKTDFFREPVHFDFLAHHVYPGMQRQRKIRIWSAACSSGEEPYTLAITLFENLGELQQVDVRILATDISTKVLQTAQEGVYSRETVSPIPAHVLRKYFYRGENKWNGYYMVKEQLKDLISFRRLNLMETFPVTVEFDFIFCRNVMIYFDKTTREGLVNRLSKHLKPGGYLFIGNAESLSGLKTPLRYVQPAIYQRPLR